MKKTWMLILTLVLVCASLHAYAQAPVVNVTLSIDSNLHGSVFTNGKSTLKSALGNVVEYDLSTSAILTLSTPDGSIDDDKIDSRNAFVSLVEGDGYYPDEYTLKATSLEGDWSNGSMAYTLSTGDFELNTDAYPLLDTNSGREWSCLGGDGQGHYTYNLMVDGIVYDGTPVEAHSFKLYIDVFGYNYSQDAVNLFGETGTAPIDAVFVSLAEREAVIPEASDKPAWTWIGVGDKPILCDTLADDFYITWPEGVDASHIANGDVKATLRSAYGDTYELEAGKDFQVNSTASETQIAVTLINWAFQPVYTSLTFDVDGVSQTYDVASVYVYQAQQGGGGTTIDGTVVVHSFYGFENLDDWKRVMAPAVYVLSIAQDDVLRYYAQNDEGAFLSEDITPAQLFDGSGTHDRNIQLIGNSIYITTRRDEQLVEMDVGGETISLIKTYPGRDSGVNAGGSLLTPATCDQTLRAMPGYVIPWGTGNWLTNEKWAWQVGVEQGFTGILISPYEGKFECAVVKGTTQQFEATLDGVPVDVEWNIDGNVAPGTAVTQEGLLTVAADEGLAQFAVNVTGTDGVRGAVTIKVE